MTSKRKRKAKALAAKETAQEAAGYREQFLGNQREDAQEAAQKQLLIEHEGTVTPESIKLAGNSMVVQRAPEFMKTVEEDNMVEREVLESENLTVDNMVALEAPESRNTAEEDKTSINASDLLKEMNEIKAQLLNSIAHQEASSARDLLQESTQRNRLVSIAQSSWNKIQSIIKVDERSPCRQVFEISQALE